MDKHFDVLKSLGAGDFQHLNGDLETHLKNTAEILRCWGASELLQRAGLFHAAYGTAGFSQSMVSITQRKSIANTIGEKEEALVYLYCSCDRDFVFPQFGLSDTIDFRDRFTGLTRHLTLHDTVLFCELTVANELELIYSSNKFKQTYGGALYDLFSRMKVYLSEPAIGAFESALSHVTQQGIQSI
jgi:hypothetical protein